MHDVLLAFVLVSALLPGIAVSTSLPDHDNPVSTPERIFARNLYQRLALASGGGNLLFSPLSVDLLLSTLLEGAGGVVRTQLTQVLALDHLTANRVRDGYRQLLTDKGSSIQILTGLFLDKNFVVNKDFVNIAKDYYHTEAITTDLAEIAEAARIINQYVMRHTNDTIRDIVTEADLEEGSSLVCVSTVHLRDSWALPFPKNMTSVQPFHTSSQTRSSVNLMRTRRLLHFVWDGTFRAKLLSLDLSTRNLSMMFMLPDQQDGLPELESTLVTLDYIPLLRLVRSVPPVTVDLFLPAFRMEGSFDLGNVLEQMGLSGLFSASADLTGVSCCGGLHVTRVKHKTYIVVEEHGIEASSATDIDLDNGAEKVSTQEFRADHPFLFFLLMNESVVFQGRMVQP